MKMILTYLLSKQLYCSYPVSFSYFFSDLGNVSLLNWYSCILHCLCSLRSLVESDKNPTQTISRKKAYAIKPANTRAELTLWLEKTMAPHSITLAWKIPWTEEPGGLQSMGSRRVGHDQSDLASKQVAHISPFPQAIRYMESYFQNRFSQSKMYK